MIEENYSPFIPIKGPPKFIEPRIELFISIGILSLNLFDCKVSGTSGLSLIYFIFLLLFKAFGLNIFGAKPISKVNCG